MGLCKCPKKKVTNLFCFEHRVNVCEHCLVANHERCIVQSYLQWLQDSDYDPTCRLCGKHLSDEACGPCVRLTCYDVFHWNCLDSYARQMPANTAPAGYTCPICSSCLFPAPNVASPVAECLRKTLVKVNWARAGLGLPLIDEPSSNRAAIPQPAHNPQLSAVVHSPSTAPPPAASAAAHEEGALQQHYGGQPEQMIQAQTQQQECSQPQHSVLSMEDSTPYARTSEKVDFNPRKLFDSTQGESHGLLNVSQDHDVDKYKRRPAMQWFARWFDSRTGKQKQDPNAGLKRFFIILIIGLFAFLTIVMIMTRVGRASADKDPFLDPLANPNIRVEGD